MPDIGVFTTICEGDVRWVNQYLTEIERLGLPFAIHFDRCSDATKSMFDGHQLCIGVTQQDNHQIEYDERAKQGVLDLLAEKRFRWALHWDMDETYEKDAVAKLDLIRKSSCDAIDTPWLNLWEDPQHIRIDGTFGSGALSKRTKFYRLNNGIRWKLRSDIVYGPSAIGRDAVEGFIDLVCLHWGYMTQELREMHKRRWDHNYGTARGTTNPYGTWQLLVDNSIVPEVVDNKFL